MHASRQISRGRLLRAKAAPLQAWTSASSVESLPPPCPSGTEDMRFSAVC
jgi:hypothetical protein